MTLSVDAKRRLTVAVANETAGAELAAAIDAQGSGPAAVVSAFGATTNLPAAACAGGASPSATNVNAAIDTVAAAAEARIDALESKVNDLLASLKAAALMATS
jgi:hypothetical protein